MGSLVESAAAQLAAQANLTLRDRPDKPEISALLAVESLRLDWRFDNDSALRQALVSLAVERAVPLSQTLSKLTVGSEGPRLSPREGLTVRSLNERFSATAGSDGAVRVVELASNRPIALLEDKRQVTALAISSSGSYVAIAREDRGAVVFRTAGETPVCKLAIDKPVTSLDFSRDEGRVAAGSRDGTARVFSVVSGQELIRISHRTWVSAVAFSPDGRYLYTLSGFSLSQYPLAREDMIQRACTLLKGRITKEDLERYFPDESRLGACPDLR